MKGVPLCPVRSSLQHICLRSFREAAGQCCLKNTRVSVCVRVLFLNIGFLILYQFAQATVTKCHRLGAQTNLLLTVLQSGESEINLVLGQGSLPHWQTLTVSSHGKDGEERRSLSLPLRIRQPILLDQSPILLPSKNPTSKYSHIED